MLSRAISIGTDRAGTNGVGNYDDVALQNSATGNLSAA